MIKLQNLKLVLLVLVSAMTYATVTTPNTPTDKPLHGLTSKAVGEETRQNKDTGTVIGSITSETKDDVVLEQNADSFIHQIILNDEYANLVGQHVISRLTAMQQKPVVMENISQFTPFVVNLASMNEKPYQLIQFFDFFCKYCEEAIPLLAEEMSRQPDVGLGYFTLLHKASPQEVVLAAFGLTKVAMEQQRDYLLKMYSLLNKNTVTLQEIEDELKRFGINYSLEELNLFAESQMKLTEQAYTILQLRGTPTFILKKSNSPDLEVLLGTQGIEHLNLYKSKIN